MSFFKPIETTNVMEAMDFGNHNFTVEKQEMNTVSGIRNPDHVAVVDINNNKYLGTVGKTWEIVQPQMIYELADELISSTNGKINGVFDMLNSSIIGISFTLAQREYISNDPIDLNFIMINSFNGMHGLSGHATSNRTACLNQCNTSNKVYNLRHTKNIVNRLEVVKNILKFYHNEIKSFDDKMMKLTGHRMSDEDAIQWFRSLFPKPQTQRAEIIASNQESLFINCLMEGRGSDIPGVKGTCYGAFQALTEYINHFRSNRVHNDREVEEVRFQSIHFGSGNTLAQKGLSNLTTSFTLTENDFMIE